MVVGFFSFLGNLTGILVETSIAAKLGLSTSSDTFYVAFTVPYVITSLLFATAQFSLVPFFAALDARQGSHELWRRFSYALNVLFLGACALSLLGAAAAPWVVRGIAPGFSSQQTEIAARLCRWLFFLVIPAAVSETLRSFLLSQHRFALPSAAGFFRNSVVIACIVYGFRRYGYASIVLGYFAGYFLQVAVLAAQTLVSFSVRYSPAVQGGGEAFRNLHGAGAAQVGSALAFQAAVIVERIIASFLPAGTLTALNYGFKIMSTLAELLAGSVGTASLPALSKAVARQDVGEERKTIQGTLEISLALVSVTTVFCLLLDRNIIRLVFERGNFTPEATALMALVFFYYSANLLLFSFVRILTFYLFARQEAALYFAFSFFLYASTIAFDLLYVGVLRLGAKGIPLGLLTGLVLICALAYRRNLAGLKRVLNRALGLFFLKNLLGSALAAFAVRELILLFKFSGSGFGNFLFLCAVCGAGSLVFFAALAASRAIPISRLAKVWQRPPEV